MLRARITDWTLALLVGAAFGTGLWTLTVGRAEFGWVFTLHAGFGFALLAVTAIKLYRVRRRVLPHAGGVPAAWRDPRTLAGILTTLLVVAVIVSGVAWVHGGVLIVWGYNLLNWHIVGSFVLVATVSLHMLLRALPLRRADLQGRRQALRLGGLLAGGLLFAPLKLAIQRGLNLPGATRRFTGSRELMSFTGNAFPTVSWMFDNPQPLAIASWHLQIHGAVTRPLSLDYAALNAATELTATLDCTGGFYSTQHWRGISVGALLDQVVPTAEARYVSFVSVTGYRWSLPLEQARTALLATHLGGETLSHGHGFPLRLVAPGERGFVWVKWLVAMEVLTHPDPGQLIAINSP